MQADVGAVVRDDGEHWLLAAEDAKHRDQRIDHAADPEERLRRVFAVQPQIATTPVTKCTRVCMALTSNGPVADRQGSNRRSPCAFVRRSPTERRREAHVAHASLLPSL